MIADTRDSIWPVARQRGDEGLVDLQAVGLQLGQIGDVGIAGAEVIQCDMHAERLKPLQVARHLDVVAEDDAFGDLEFEPIGG